MFLQNDEKLSRVGRLNMIKSMSLTCSESSTAKFYGIFLERNEAHENKQKFQSEIESLNEERRNRCQLIGWASWIKLSEFSIYKNQTNLLYSH